MSEQTSAMPDPETLRRFVRQHFEDFINRKDAGAIRRNVHPEYVDHLPGGRTVTLAEATERSDGLFAKYPDVHVDVRDVLVDGDKVVTRAVWMATEAGTGRRVEFHGFVLFRMADGKLIERWATMSPPQDLPGDDFVW